MTSSSDNARDLTVPTGAGTVARLAIGALVGIIISLIILPGGSG